jgi:hypothetical protein
METVPLRLPVSSDTWTPDPGAGSFSGTSHPAHVQPSIVVESDFTSHDTLPDEHSMSSYNIAHAPAVRLFDSRAPEILPNNDYGYVMPNGNITNLPTGIGPQHPYYYIPTDETVLYDYQNANSDLSQY